MAHLQVIEKNGQLLVDSREVAKMIGKQHTDLLRSVDGYISILENAKLRFQDFFVESNYKVGGNNKTYKCYFLTRKGCDMVANKLTGEKGVLFTASYVTRFEEMEKQIQNQVQIVSKKEPDLELNIKMKNAEARLKNAKVREANLLLKMVTDFNLSQESKQAIASYTAVTLTGKELIQLPEVKGKTYTATEIGNMVGVSRNKVGKVANENNLKIDEYGMMLLSKSEHSSKQVSTFVYNEKGKETLIRLFQQELVTV